MSWKILFIAGLAASLLPLNLQIADYTFPYPILGFGLILLSYLFKPIRFADVLNIAVLVITIILGIFNLLGLYIAFQLFFYLTLSLNFLFTAKKSVWNFLPAIVVFATPVAFIVQSLEALGVFALPHLVDALTVAIAGMCLAYLLLNREAE